MGVSGAEDMGLYGREVGEADVLTGGGRSSSQAAALAVAVAPAFVSIAVTATRLTRQASSANGGVREVRSQNDAGKSRRVWKVPKYRPPEFDAR